MEEIHTFGEYAQMLKDMGLATEIRGGGRVFAQPVRHISYNSRDVKVGTLFVCKGAHFSKDYLKQAILEGSIAYISENPYDFSDEEDERLRDIPCVLVNDMRRTLSHVAGMFYGTIWKKLTTIGITGTKGKSTVTYFMKSILDEYMKDMKRPETAVLSGIDNYDGVIREESHLTTPETFELYKHFENAVKSGIEYLTMEVSSQALKYHRTLGILYTVGCFLNIGLDHISDAEHQDFTDYFHSKLKLFNQCEIACINLDSDHAEEMVDSALSSKSVERRITFSTTKEAADIYGYDMVSQGGKLKFKAKCDSFDEMFEIGMPGLFNVSNALAAIAICYGLNIPLPYIKKGLSKARVSGRMEVYTDRAAKKMVIVDYAHNKMSFESLFKAMKAEFPGKKLAIVFGCPGGKALGRRQELGLLAGEHCDYVYITEEDPGEEVLSDICIEVAGYVRKFPSCHCEIVYDRDEAIRRAIQEHGEEAVILVTGKGRETRQKRGIQYIPVESDVEIVKKYL